MTGEPAKNFHGVDIGPLSKILAVKTLDTDVFNESTNRTTYLLNRWKNWIYKVTFLPEGIWYFSKCDASLIL